MRVFKSMKDELKIYEVKKNHLVAGLPTSNYITEIFNSLKLALIQIRNTRVFRNLVFVGESDGKHFFPLSWLYLRYPEKISSIRHDLRPPQGPSILQRNLAKTTKEKMDVDFYRFFELNVKKMFF